MGIRSCARRCTNFITYANQHKPTFTEYVPHWRSLLYQHVIHTRNALGFDSNTVSERMQVEEDEILEILAQSPQMGSGGGRAHTGVEGLSRCTPPSLRHSWLPRPDAGFSLFQAIRTIPPGSLLTAPFADRPGHSLDRGRSQAGEVLHIKPDRALSLSFQREHT